MRLQLTTVITTLTLSLAPLTAGAEPKNFKAVYKARYYGISVTATRSLETLEDGTQRFSFLADSWLADRKEVSHFRWDDDWLVPLEYRYERNGLGKDREAVLKFDWDDRNVINNVQQKPWEMELPELALDKLGYQLQIRNDLLNDREEFHYEVADGGWVKEYRFEVLGEEQVETDAGRFDAVKIRRVREDDEDRETIFWMAKNWDYLVVRLQQNEDGSTYEIDLHEATVGGQPVKGI